MLLVENIDPVEFMLIKLLILPNLLLQLLHELSHIILLVVVLILQSQEVLIEGNAVSEEGLVARRLVLLVDFSVLEQLDFVLQQHCLLLQVQDVLLLQSLRHLVLLFSQGPFLGLLVGPLQVRVALVFLVSN